MEADFDRRLGRQVRRQMADRAAADRRAIVGRGALALDDLHQDRALVGLRGAEDRGAAVTGRAVLRGMRMPLRLRRVSGSMPTTPRLCELTFLMEKVAGRPWRSARIRPARNAAPWATASSAATEASGGLPETCWSMSRTMGMRVEPPTSRTRSRSRPIQPGRLQRLHRREPRAIQEVLGRLLELLPRLISIREAAAAILADHGGLAAGGERPLGVLAFQPQLAGRVGVLAGIAAMLAAETARPPGRPAAGPSR